MNGMEHAMHMPGMLTDEQMKQLDAARGTEFDRLFLTFMIQHHRGAVTMVQELFDATGAGAGRAGVQDRRQTSTSIRRRRSHACRRCSLALPERRQSTNRLPRHSEESTDELHRHCVSLSSRSCCACERFAASLRRQRLRRRDPVAAGSDQPARPPSPIHASGLKAGSDRRRRGDLEHAAGLEDDAVRRSSSASPTPIIAFTGNYAIQGNYNGFQIWDISNPAAPTLTKAYVCPASQSDVSVYKNLLFVSGEGSRRPPRLRRPGRAGHGQPATGCAASASSTSRDITNPKNVGNVQTCRGSHTHSVLVDPKDPSNVYIYISGSSPVRSAERAARLRRPRTPDKDPNSALFRIEVIKVPLANPAAGGDRQLAAHLQ